MAMYYYIRTSHLAILARSAMLSVNTFDGAACGTEWFVSKKWPCI